MEDEQQLELIEECNVLVCIDIDIYIVPMNILAPRTK
jgi:hypothetical protein